MGCFAYARGARAFGFDTLIACGYAGGVSREYVLQPFRPAVHLQIDYARELNEQQHAAVTASPVEACCS